MCLLVIKMFTNERPLDYLSQTLPFCVTKHLHAELGGAVGVELKWAVYQISYCYYNFFQLQCTCFHAHIPVIYTRTNLFQVHPDKYHFVPGCNYRGYDIYF